MYYYPKVNTIPLVFGSRGKGTQLPLKPPQNGTFNLNTGLGGPIDVGLGPGAPGGAGCPWRGPLRALGGRVHPTRDHIGCRAETCMDKGCLPFALKTYRKTYRKNYA